MKLREDYPFGKLENIKKGDYLLYSNQLSESIVEVARITKTLICIKLFKNSEIKFKKNGSLSGGSVWNKTFIRAFNSIEEFKEKKEKILKEKIIKSITKEVKSKNFGDNLDITRLMDIYNILFKK